MRAVHQVIELALSLLDKNPIGRDYMCCHLDWLTTKSGGNLISNEESCAAQDVIRAAIGNNVTLAGYLREVGAMPQQVAVRSAEYPHYQLTFYRGLIAKLRAAAPMFLIIEAAYHCAHSNAEIHASVKAAGLPETSDETIANLLGAYADSIKE